MFNSGKTQIVTALFLLEPPPGLSSGKQSVKNSHNYIKTNIIQCLRRVPYHQSGWIKPYSVIGYWNTKIKSGDVSFVVM